MYGQWDTGAWIWMSVLMVLFVAVLTAVIVALVRFGGRDDRDHPSPRGLDVLDERFARGEIDNKEYEERRRASAGNR